MNSVQIGGKTLYLVPWMEAKKSKKNVIESDPCWVNMENVPRSFWSSRGFAHIAKAVGIPLNFDENTARFEPLRFSSVQVMLSYSSPRPDFIWVLVEDEFGVSELVKVSFVCPQLPYSCGHCRVFGHSFSRCINNPNAVKTTPRVRPVGVSQEKAKAHRQDNRGKDKEPVLLEQNDSYHNTVEGSNIVTDNINPVVVDEFIGCDVVLDDDQMLEKIHNGDDLENCDTVPTVIGNVEVDVAQSQTELVEHVAPAALAAHTDLELGLSMTDAQAAPAAPPAQAASIELTMQLVPQTLESQISPINVVDSIVAPQTMVTSPVNQK